jgi:hypothetical protein
MGAAARRLVGVAARDFFLTAGLMRVEASNPSSKPVPRESGVCEVHGDHAEQRTRSSQCGATLSDQGSPVGSIGPKRCSGFGVGIKEKRFEIGSPAHRVGQSSGPGRSCPCA